MIQKSDTIVFGANEKNPNNTRQKLKTDISNLPYSLDTCGPSLKTLYDFLYQKIYLKWQTDNEFVKNLGGLFVLGTERHETRRIDNQLRGRAGRQGDPGFSQFFVSLDDELIKIFGGESIRGWLNFLMNDKDTPLESNFLTQSLENAQKKIESYNYEIRKNVFQYDEVVNVQRKQLFKIRNEILSNNLYNDLALRYAEFTFDLEFLEFSKIEKESENSIKIVEEFFSLLEKYFNNSSTLLAVQSEKISFIQQPFYKKNVFSFVFSRNSNPSFFLPDFLGKKENSFKKQFYPEIWISNEVRFAKSNVYQLGFLKNTQTTILLAIIDFYWTEHIERLNYIRDTVNWRAYGQQNPLIEYNMEASSSYKLMLEQIRSSMLYYLLESSVLK
jgi:preprotein translocase subunit SecA